MNQEHFELKETIELSSDADYLDISSLLLSRQNIKLSAGKVKNKIPQVYFFLLFVFIASLGLALIHLS